MVTEWIITEIDGKIASIAGDYGHFAELAAKIAQLPPTSVDVISNQKVSTDELVAMPTTGILPESRRRLPSCPRKASAPSRPGKYRRMN